MRQNISQTTRDCCSHKKAFRIHFQPVITSVSRSRSHLLQIPYGRVCAAVRARSSSTELAISQQISRRCRRAGLNQHSGSRAVILSVLDVHRIRSRRTVRYCDFMECKPLPFIRPSRTDLFQAYLGNSKIIPAALQTDERRNQQQGRRGVELGTGAYRAKGSWSGVLPD